MREPCGVHVVAGIVDDDVAPHVGHETEVQVDSAVVLDAVELQRANVVKVNAGVNHPLQLGFQANLLGDEALHLGDGVGGLHPDH